MKTRIHTQHRAKTEQPQPAAPSPLPPNHLQHTKIPTQMFATNTEAEQYVAAIIEALIRKNNAVGVPTVLGLPTGSTPIGIYQELIRLHQTKGLDFSNVVTFNLDEYWPMHPDSLHSYQRWMNESFFEHVNILPGNIHIPNGNLPREKVDSFCKTYEQKIAQAGGIDLQLLGIGRTGHIGFNEPGSTQDSTTRLVTLDTITRHDAAADFFGEENVPHQAITMGVGTILAAKQIIVVALGEHKANIVQRTVEEEMADDITASFLQEHPNTLFVVDAAAGNELTAAATPWVVGHIKWTPQTEQHAVIWLSEKTGKPLLKLEQRDFTEHHLHDLLRERGPINKIRERVFQDRLNTICTEPAGTERKTILLFSPHPDDDVISMGGTLITLVEQGHDVHIAYMTSGNIAVFDHDALRHIDYVEEFLTIFGLSTVGSDALLQELNNNIRQRQPGEPDSEKLLSVKSLIRKTEAAAGALIAGVPPAKLHFLDLPFYQTGEVTKDPVDHEDVAIIAERLRALKPDQIYVAGDLSDPHGTHRVCAQAIIQAYNEVQAENIRPEFWLYRGAWQEYEAHEIERAVPLSPEIMHKKKLAIFRHESQKDRALFPGLDEREFWVRAEERTKNTARIYNELGLPEYYALEGFVRFAGQL